MHACTCMLNRHGYAEYDQAPLHNSLNSSNTQLHVKLIQVHVHVCYSHELPPQYFHKYCVWSLGTVQCVFTTTLDENVNTTETGL